MSTINVLTVGPNDTKIHQQISDILGAVDDLAETADDLPGKRDSYKSSEAVRIEVRRQNIDWFAALVNDRVVGVAKKEMLSLDSGDMMVHFSDLKVLPAYRGRGVAKALFKAYVQNARVICSGTKNNILLTLGVVPGNSIREWYEKLGFTLAFGASDNHPYDEFSQYLDDLEEEG